MGENRGYGTKIVFVVLALAMVALAVFFLIDRDDGSDEVSTEADRDAQADKKSQLREKSQQLKKVLAAKTPKEKKKIPPMQLIVPTSQESGDSTDKLTLAEKVALNDALARVYDPAKLIQSLQDHTGVEYTKKMAEAFGELQQATVLETGGGEVPVTPAVKMVISRISVVRAYAMNLMHSERPGGEEAYQWELVSGVNERFEARFATVMDEHPFLDLQMVKIPGD